MMFRKTGVIYHVICVSLWYSNSLLWDKDHEHYYDTIAIQLMCQDTYSSRLWTSHNFTVISTIFNSSRTTLNSFSTASASKVNWEVWLCPSWSWASPCIWASRERCQLSPAARGGWMPHRPSTIRIWDGCAELGTFEHIAWDCPRRLCNVPKPAKFCLLGMVGLVLIKRVTLMLCKLGWSVCKRFFGPLSVLDLCLLFFFRSWRPPVSLVLPT